MVRDGDALESLTPMKPGCFGVQADLDVWRVLDPIDEVLRHLDPKIGIAAEKPNPAGVSRQKHGGLTGGVGAADDRDLLSLAAPGFEVRRRVVDRAGESVLSGETQPPISGACRDDDTAPEKRAALVELHRITVRASLQRRGAARNGNARAEFESLNLRAKGEIIA